MARGDELIKSRVAESQRASSSPGKSQDPVEAAARYIERYFGSMLRDFQLLKEKVELLTGERGDGTLKALTLAEPGSNSGSGGGTTIIVGGNPVDASTPTQPQNFQASGGFTHIILEWTPAAYTGHKHTEIWRNLTDDFGTATKINTTEASLYSDNVELNSKFYYWARFVNLLDQPGQESQSAYAETAPNISAEMQRISDYLNSGQLAAELRARIDLIDQPDTGLVDKLIREINDRIAAIQQEIGDRTTAIQNEAAQRSDAVSAEATERNLLAAQMRGNYGGGDLNLLTEGLLYQERTTRATQADALAQQISLLSAGVGGGFDPQETWYFDSDSQGWLATGAALTWIAGWIRLTSSGSDPQLLKSGLSIVGTQYATLKMRIKRIAGAGWDGNAYYSTSGHGFSIPNNKSLSDPGLAVGDVAIIAWDFSDIADWTASTVTGFRVDLGATSADVFDIDWIAVGREAPGASVASLLNEQVARANADSAEASSRQALSTKLVGAADPSSLTLGAVTSGLLADEKNARSTADSAEVAARQTLSVKMIGAADPNSIGGLAQVTSGLLAEEKSARVTSDAAISSSITTINSRLDNTTTGLAATATALQSTTTTVTQQGTQLTANTQSLNQIQAIVGNNYAALQQMFTVSSAADGSVTATALIKMDVNGYISGYGMWNNGTTSQAIFNVDDFAVGKAGAGTVYPFIVSGGVTYMKSAMIQQASITSGQIQNLTVDKIVGDTASFVINNIGYATIDFANIQNNIQSGNYVSGAAGWRIDKSGWAEFRNIIARGDIEASSLKANTAIVNTANIVNANVTALKIAGNSATVIVGAQATAAPCSVSITVTTDDIPAFQSTVPIIVTGSADTSQDYFFDVAVNPANLGGTGNLIAALPPAGVSAFSVDFLASPGTYTFWIYNHGAPTTGFGPGTGADPGCRKRSIMATLGKR